MSFWVLMAFRMDVSFWANCNLEAPGIRLRIQPLKQPGLIEGGDVGATDGVGTCWRGPLRFTRGERDAVNGFGSGGDIEPVLAGSSPDPGQRWAWGPWVFIFPSRQTWIVRPQTAQGVDVILPGMAPVEEEGSVVGELSGQSELAEEVSALLMDALDVGIGACRSARGAQLRR